MSKTTRDLLKRKLAQAYININWSGAYIYDLKILFEKDHPDLAELLDIALQGLDSVQQIMTGFAIKAWDTPNPNWESWAATGRPRHGENE